MANDITSTTSIGKGGTLYSPYIHGKGRVHVLSGGSVSGAHIYSGGTEFISAFGSDTNASVYAGGGLEILSSGTVYNPYVSDSAYISASGGRVLGGTVGNGGILTMKGYDAGSSFVVGYASDVHIVSAGSMDIGWRGMGSAIQVDSGNVTIYSGGTMQGSLIGGNTMTVKGARVTAMTGASAHANYIQSNGILYVSSGAKATANRVSAGGSVHVAPNGLISGTICSGGIVFLSGGSAVSTTVLKESGTNGGLWLSSGAVATSTTIDSGGTMVIGSGASTLGSNSLKDGLVSVGTGGEAYNFQMSGGILRVFIGGVASSISVGGGYFYLLATPEESTGFASATWVSIYGSGSACVYNSALLSSAFVQGGGVLNVMSGGSANSIKVSSGGLMHTSEAVATNVDVMTNGELKVQKSGWVSGGSVYGTVNVSSGASVNNLSILLLGKLNVEGVASNCTIYSGGIVNVSSGGKLYGAYASTGGNFTIQAGGTATISSGAGISASVTGGNLTVSAADVRTVTLTSGGALSIKEQSYVSSGYIYAGTLAISSGCSTGIISAYGDGTGIALAQLTVLTGAKTSNGRIGGKDGRLKVNSGGSAFDMIIESAGTATVSGIIESANVSSGGFLSVVTGDGLASRTSLGSGGSMELGTSTGAVVTSIGSGAALTIMYSATANLVHVNGGNLTLRSGGSAISAYVRDGGSAILNSTAQITNAYIEKDGRIDVYSSGSVFNAQVSSGGLLKNSGGYLGNFCVSNGGTVICDSGYVWGYVSAGGNVIFSGGYSDNLFVREGGRVRMAGYVDLTGGGYVAVYSGATLDFDISNQAPGSEMPIVDGFDGVDDIAGGALFTLTVADAQTYGSYQLASNALAFNKTITVQDTAGAALGTLALGSKTTIGDYDYTLAVDVDQVLTVSVEAAEPKPPVPGDYVAKFDIDGNGISDVMFVWTGYNYAEGYWMNGTSEWRSTMAIHPAEWETLGCYDMTGDGKADSVLVGNVEIGGNKGAYIGYYADANDTDDNWVNIDYLNNNAGVNWINKIGNLTGGAANSIVWYAPDLYTLGAWTDGTANWVTITGTFGGDWTLVGCGDFDGDGKDSILMTAGGAMYYAADLDGTVKSMGDANWSGWEVRAIGDFKGDGKEDLVLFHKELGSMVMCADGNLDDFESIGQLDAIDWFVVGAGDYNGDQKDDLLVRQYSTGMLGYYDHGDVATGWVELGRGVDMNWTVIA